MRESNKKYFSFEAPTKILGRVNKGKYKESWIESTALIGSINAQKIKAVFSYSRVYFFVFTAFCIIFIVVLRLVWLQIINGEHYYSLAQGNRIRLERVEPKRGIIYDKDHRPLVRNVANFLLYFTPSDFSKDKLTRLEILFKISQILENNPSMNSMESELKDIKRGSLKFYQPLFIADSIPYEKAMKLLLVSKNWPGVIITNKTRREYDLDSLSMSHLLGYTGKISQSELEKNNNSDYYPIDYVGKMGLENFWETELRGIKGQKQIEVDALGKEKRIIQEEAPIDGSHLVISIDSFLQQKIEQITLEHLKDFKVKRAVIIASNPANGEIMAMVNIPSFNNNAFARGIAQKEYDELIDNEDRPLLDRAIGGEYPSGSTIKLVMSAAALQDGIINEKTTFLSTGGLRIKDWFFPDWKAGGHGRTDVKKALADSVNTFYYYIGGGYGDFQGLGVNKIVYYATLFGLNAQTGIDLPGESSGFLPTKEWKLVTKGERWYIGDTYHLAIGQGDILVTPLQVAMFTSTVANGGKLYRPHLVKEIISPKNETVKTIDDTPVRENFISPQNIDIIKQGMRQSVTSGSSRRLNGLPIEVAGKTGTAQWSTKKITHAWFTGFAPYNNPTMALTVLIEQGGEGSSTAVPIAFDIWKWYFGGKPETQKATSTERVIDKTPF